MASFFIFLFGLATGSFLNAFIYRMEQKKSVLLGRSYCPHCKHTLAWHDLIPLLSFILLYGRCRYCNKRISVQYPLVELATGFLFVAIFLFLLPSMLGSELVFAQGFVGALKLSYLLSVAALLVVIFVYDLKHYLIPDKVLFFATLLSGIWYFAASVFFHLYTAYQIQNAIYAALGAAGFFLAIYVLSKGRAMGFGDVKLAFFMGLFLGFPNILAALFVAFFVGGAIGLVLILAGKKKMKSQVPFGPFLVLGTFVALFFGERVVDFYLSLLGV
jgi:leader peptidase (prepilin peptidase) / N-methyltransferase